MLSYMISLVHCMAPMWTYVFNFFFALAFLATVPVLIRDIFRGS